MTLSLHLVELQSMFAIAITLSGLLVILAFMLAVKNSRYKALQRELLYESSTRKGLWDELQLAITQAKKFKEEVEEDYAKRQVITDMWMNLYHALRDSLPKPQPRTPDGRFLKGSERLDNLRKHLMAGGRTDRNHARETFNISDVSKSIAKLKKEGFVVRKARRKIAEGTHLTEYYLAPEKGPRHWAAQPVD